MIQKLVLGAFFCIRFLPIVDLRYHEHRKEQVTYVSYSNFVLLNN
jgi:hypothetical protein